MNEQFEARMSDPKVRKDTRTLADLTSIYCRAHHADRARGPASTSTATLGVYGRRPPVLCEECAAHLEYGERRRAYCPKEPKPYCAHCDVHCYRATESEWQRQMMRFSGPRSVLHGHALDAMRHALEGRKHRKAAAVTTPAFQGQASGKITD